MTRDGVVETNKATGEQTRTSNRETDDFSGDTAESMTGKALNRAATERQRHKAKTRRRKAKKEAKQAAKAAGQPQASRLQFTDAERTAPDVGGIIHKFFQIGFVLGYVRHIFHNNRIILPSNQLGNQHIYRITVNIPVRSLVDDSFIHQRYPCHAALHTVLLNNPAEIAF